MADTVPINPDRDIYLITEEFPDSIKVLAKDAQDRILDDYILLPEVVELPWLAGLNSREKENAVTAWRATIGATNPEEAAEGTIRFDFATSIGENAVHGSDSDENAKKEIGFFFTESELITNQ